MHEYTERLWRREVNLRSNQQRLEFSPSPPKGRQHMISGAENQDIMHDTSVTFRKIKLNILLPEKKKLQELKMVALGLGNEARE